jgi:hypothetical protein
MPYHTRWIANSVVLTAVVVFSDSSAHAQTSPSTRRVYTSAQAFRISPGDRMFQATMTIASSYRNRDRSVSPPAAARPSTRAGAARIAVIISPSGPATLGTGQRLSLVISGGQVLVSPE